MNYVEPPSLRNGAADPVVVARRWLDQYGQAALATVVSTWGSAPVPAGGQLVVGPDERFEGSVSGGCVEADVIAEAGAAMADGTPRILEFGVSEETAWRAGLPCGGHIKVLLEPLTFAKDAHNLDRILAARGERKLITITTDVATGARQIYDPESGTLPELASDLPHGTCRLADTPNGDVFVQSLAPPVRVIIAGATNIGQALAGLARQVGYDVVVVDPRGAFLTEERFAGTAGQVAWPEATLASLGLDVRTAVVALTHAAHIDDEALSAALRGPCLYIGALGSRATHAKRLERLREAGFTDADLARIHAPVGLDIGAKGPAEIAVSILAQIIQTARKAK